MILLLSLYGPDTLDNPTGVRSHKCRIRESLLLLLMITEDQQSYIRSMNLIELEPKEIQSGLETGSCLESPSMQEYDQEWPVMQYIFGRSQNT
ncbi:hypothetical protein AVEN_102305-1 [Araneus ventricosus]|uniref:Uncharacterized protein n=1 Tax=Araneus ventricosus TaxID=182803 RepID=A0A4Y2MM23_ARAVE|nr:hypothetical protein AVEN_162508-1 [Araneus ventricosus]GBN36476.1 hypothetical protein AVEN_102305-1 [Araneus ventricosus]